MSPSYIWKSLVKTYPLFKKGISWNISNGEEVNLWEDKWIEATLTLRETIQGPLTEQDIHLLVSHMLSNNSWDPSKLSFDIPSHIKESILNTYI
ncbi:hypothetical protein R3W88_026807 [Solanum pinnatisectum]|uniref:Reverse transcriptase zinc-binding domain-containing protein n=1 Tax=Solanum pinnatisectum TaxID=50273 RepID=A0AAV9LF21_9SOLN|nr:hypothetical protein R3W88_026807 [Solanum pinnatisectum]